VCGEPYGSRSTTSKRASTARCAYMTSQASEGSFFINKACVFTQNFRSDNTHFVSDDLNLVGQQKIEELQFLSSDGLCHPTQNSCFGQTGLK
jgi:hypothetical protein